MVQHARGREIIGCGARLEPAVAAAMVTDL